MDTGQSAKTQLTRIISSYQNYCVHLMVETQLSEQYDNVRKISINFLKSKVRYFI